jgi:hypothetical protein
MQPTIKPKVKTKVKSKEIERKKDENNNQTNAIVTYQCCNDAKLQIVAICNGRDFNIGITIVGIHCFNNVVGVLVEQDSDDEGDSNKTEEVDDIIFYFILSISKEYNDSHILSNNQIHNG